MAASSFHIEQPQDNGMFSRRFICYLVLAGLGGIILTGNIHWSISVVCTDISSIFIATLNLFVDMTKNLK